MSRNLKAIENYNEKLANEPEYDGEYRLVNNNPYANVESKTIKVKDEIDTTNIPKVKVLVDLRRKV